MTASRLVAPALATALALAAPLRAEAPRSGPASGVDERVGATLPLDAEFTTSTGVKTTLGSALVRGRPALLVLSYSHCAMLCSLVLRGVSELVRDSRDVPGRDFSVVNVSIDPRETPGEARRTQEIMLSRAGYPGAVARWPFLVGERDAIDRVAQSVGFRYAWDPRTEQYAHPAVLVVVSGRGEIMRYVYGVRFEPGEIAAALRGAAEARKPSLAERALRCFRFDGAAQRYAGLIHGIFRAGAALLLGGLLLGIALLVRRERAHR